MNLRDELNRRLTDFDLDVSEDFIDTLLPWLEQKLTEAQAATAEGCAGLADKMSDRQVIFEKLPSCSESLLIAGAFRVLAKAIRALSPLAPGWLERQKKRWELEAAIAEHDAVCDECRDIREYEAAYPEVLPRVCERRADLERQLADLNLTEVKK